MSQNKNYINGIFIREEEGDYGSYLSIGITEEGMDALFDLAMNAKGIRNFKAFRQKNDDTKFSCLGPDPNYKKENSGPSKQQRQQPSRQREQPARQRPQRSQKQEDDMSWLND